MERNDEGKFEARLYGPDGKAVSGFSEDGTPQYVDGSDISTRIDTPTTGEDKTQILRNTPRGDGNPWNNDQINNALIDPLKEGSLDRLANEG